MAVMKKTFVIVGLREYADDETLEDLKHKLREVIPDEVGICIIDGCSTIATIETLVKVPIDEA